MEEKLHLRMSKEVRLNSRVLLLWAYHLKALRPAELIEPVVHSFCRLLSSQSSHTDTHTQSAYKELGHRSLKCVSSLLSTGSGVCERRGENGVPFGVSAKNSPTGKSRHSETAFQHKCLS